MNIATYQEAADCADSAPAGLFGIDDLVEVAALTEIIYYGFELWKSCHHASSPASDCNSLAKAAKQSICGNAQGDGQRYSAELLRSAGRGMHRAATVRGIRLSRQDRDALTTHMLNHVATSSDGVIAGCYHESPAAAIAAMEGVPDES